MHRLKYALRFIRETYHQAKDHPSFQQIISRYVLGGLALVVLWFFPLALIVGLIGLSPVGLVGIGLVMVLAFISLYIWGKITMLQAISMFDISTQPDEPAYPVAVEQQWIGSQTGDAALFALSLPGLRIAKLFVNWFYPKRQQQYQWLDAAYLVWPLMSLESLPLDNAIQRLRQMLRENLIRFQPGLVPVDLVVKFVQWLLILLGLWIGFVVGLNVADPVSTSGIIPVLGTLIGVILGGFFVIFGIHFSTFIQASYYAALYRWVKNVETANITGTPGKATPPAILGQVLGKP